MLVVTCANVVINVPCDAMQPALGLGFLGPLSSLVALLPRVVAPGVAVCLGKSLVHHCHHQSRDLGGLGINGGREIARQFGDFGCECGGKGREGGWGASSEVVPWKLVENPADPVVYAVSRRYFSALHKKKVNSDHDDSDVWSAQSRSAMSNIPDFRMFSIAIRRIVLS